MADLPADNYVNDNARTEGEMKTALEQFRDRFAQMIGGGVLPGLEVISSGSITPSEGLFLIDTEGGGPTDDLVSIVSASFPVGSLIMMRTINSSRNVVLKHGTGADNLINHDNADITLSEAGDYVIYERLFGGNWLMISLNRQFVVDSRSDLGLGNAALATVGTGNGLDADKVDGLDASAFLLVGATAVDSGLLGGISAANYHRKDEAAGVQVDLNLYRNEFGRIVIRDNAGVNPRVDFEAASVLRARHSYTGQVFSSELYDAAGTTLDGGIRSRVGSQRPQWYHRGDTAWKDLADEEETDISLKAASAVSPAIRLVVYGAGNASGQGGGTHFNILASIQLPALPSGFSSVPVLIEGYILKDGSASNPKANLYIGPTGDQNDTEIFRINNQLIMIAGSENNIPTMPGHIYTYPGGTIFVTLIYESGSSGGWAKGFLKTTFLTNTEYL